MVQNFFQGSINLNCINKSLLVPIPKVVGTNQVFEFRPISICNESYKIIFKLLVSRLKQVLHKYIRWEQPAFIEARQIIDNIALVMECFKRLGEKVKSKLFAMKLDMSKAFDRVE